MVTTKDVLAGEEIFFGIIVMKRCGTPGIGKSVQFGNYVFYQAAKAKRNVFFDQVSCNVGYLFKADGKRYQN
jgi:hypothetical protein